ncbi:MULTISPECIES: hypothetical protein [Halomonadaceae]|uniref:hypothetical protein n=1 Tax=Halomonadaceae TaxID=28256 RepID=UPI00159AC4F7|nr:MULTISPECIES: hypothetical protein [Halomonas]QJQ93907.1 hypothetical protein HIO72_00425 [Halomonas sp. PA5]
MSWTTAASNALNSIGTYATNAFEWLDDNPTAANVIGGVASGAGTYYAQKQQQNKQMDFQREMYGRQRKDQMANPGEIGDYSSHASSLSKGLLSHGMVTGG